MERHIRSMGRMSLKTDILKQLDLLDLLLNDMNNVKISDIQQWLDETRLKVNKPKLVKSNELNQWDKAHYIELSLFGGIHED